MVRNPEYDRKFFETMVIDAKMIQFLIILGVRINRKEKLYIYLI